MVQLLFSLGRTFWGMFFSNGKVCYVVDIYPGGGGTPTASTLIAPSSTKAHCTLRSIVLTQHGTHGVARGCACSCVTSFFYWLIVDFRWIQAKDNTSSAPDFRML